MMRVLAAMKAVLIVAKEGRRYWRGSAAGLRFGGFVVVFLRPALWRTQPCRSCFKGRIGVATR